MRGSGVETEDEYVRRTMARMRAGLEQWQRYVESCRDRPKEQVDAELCATIADEARRQGVPVTGAHMHAGVVVLEVAAPKGYG